jgi:hypothetical protein
VVSADNEVAGCYIGEQLVQGRAAVEVVAGDAVIDVVLRALPEDGRLSMTKSLSETERALALGIDAEVLPFFLGTTQENPKRRSASTTLSLPVPAGEALVFAMAVHCQSRRFGSALFAKFAQDLSGEDPGQNISHIRFRFGRELRDAKQRLRGCSWCGRFVGGAGLPLRCVRARVRRRSRTIDEVRAQEAAYQHPHDQTLRQVRFERLGDRSPAEDLHPYDDRGSDHQAEAVHGQRTKGDFGSGKVGNHRCVGLSASRHRKTRTDRTLPAAPAASICATVEYLWAAQPPIAT